MAIMNRDDVILPVSEAKCLKKITTKSFCFVLGYSGAITAILAIMAGMAFASEPPRLSDVVVDSANLMLGVGERWVTISVRIVDGDADLDLKRVKLKKIQIGKKNPTVARFADDGRNGDVIANDGRFTTKVLLDTSIPRQRAFRIKAKDRLGNKAVPLSFTIVVGPSLGLSSAPLPSTLDLELERAFPELTFSDPVALLQAPSSDTRWFLVERTGIILTFLNQPNMSEVTTALDFRHVVEPMSERDLELGMLALAFHPNFSKNGNIYIYYTAQINKGIESRLSRFVSIDQGTTFDPDSEEILIHVEQPRNRHNGGQLAFGPDGFLYLSLGDGGDRFESQDRESFLGKILRIDVDGKAPYMIPPDNPFVGEGGRPEIYAMGLRNPWRWSFDPVTGVLWLGDVGNRRWEEINVIVSGGNYGWPILEGNECAGFLPCDTSNLINPIGIYSHDEGCSVIGGHVYHGADVPEIEGVYLFSDFCSGAIMGLSTDVAGTLVHTVFVQGGHDPDTEEFSLLVRSLSVDQNGEIYIVANDGRIFKLVRAER